MNKEKVQELISQLIKEIEGKDELRPETRETPRRVANSYSEIFDGYQLDLDKDIKILKPNIAKL